jgi:GxxExxY protein
MIHEELSGKIIGAAMGVLNELRPGLDDPAAAGLRTRAMIIELNHRGHSVSVQSSFPVSYRGELIGNLIPDLIVDDAVIVDPKVVSCFTETHVAQMIGYLNITRLDLALLMNFKNARLEWKRVLRLQEPDPAAAGPNPDLHA